MSIYNGNTRGSFVVSHPGTWVSVALAVTFGPVALAILCAVLHWAWATS